MSPLNRILHSLSAKTSRLWSSFSSCNRAKMLTSMEAIKPNNTCSTPPAMPTAAAIATVPLAKPKADALLDDKDMMQRVLMQQERCILVDEQDRVVGSASKRDCHLMENIDRGMLHRAFSVIMFNSRNECLLTQRASTKITFPDYFTNACCSHPLHTELEMEQSQDDVSIGVKRAAQRRLAFELGIDPLEIPLEDFKYITRVLYKAPSNEGIWGEHEVDYILILRKDVQMQPNENEVRSFQYLSKSAFRSAVGESSQMFVFFFNLTPLFMVFRQSQRTSFGHSLVCRNP